jgi:undecaprenyl-diphosphatase
MTRPDEPVEERLADRLSHQTPDQRPAGEPLVQLLRRLGTYDRAAYAAVARMPTPTLDAPLRELSGFANHSKPWLILAGTLAVLGGPRGRRAALTGVAAIGVASLVVNQPMKLIGARSRPARQQHGIPESRWVPMPTSTSFPSGHSASAAAFAVAVGSVLPALAIPVGASAAVVAFSRVYTGVHYPGDVLVGVGTGALLGGLCARVGRRVGRG